MRNVFFVALAVIGMAVAIASLTAGNWTTEPQPAQSIIEFRRI